MQVTAEVGGGKGIGWVRGARPENAGSVSGGVKGKTRIGGKQEDEKEEGDTEFCFCSKCGCVTHWWRVTRKGKIGVVEGGKEGIGGWMGVNARIMDRRVLEGVDIRVREDGCCGSLGRKPSAVGK